MCVCICSVTQPLAPSFSVTRGTRQDSVLSPYFFNIFIMVFSCLEPGQNIVSLPNLGFTDVITLFSSTVAGLQGLIDNVLTIL